MSYGCFLNVIFQVMRVLSGVGHAADGPGSRYVIFKMKRYLTFVNAPPTAIWGSAEGEDAIAVGSFN